MMVMKFGGTSLKDAEMFRKSAGINKFDYYTNTRTVLVLIYEKIRYYYRFNYRRANRFINTVNWQESCFGKSGNRRFERLFELSAGCFPITLRHRFIRGCFNK